MGKHAIEAPRSTTYMVDPADLSVVYNSHHPNFDPSEFSPKDIDDRNHPYYDKRVHLPADVPLAENIFNARRVYDPLKVVMEGDRTIVFDGRQRRRSCMLANQWLIEQGENPIRVEVKLYRTREALELIKVSATSNNQRIDDTVLDKAERAYAMLSRGASQEEIMDALRVKAWVTVERWMMTLDLAPAVQKALEAGEVSLDRALKVRNQPIEKQESLIAKSVAKRPATPKIAWLITKDGEPDAIAKTEAARSRMLSKREEEHPDAEWSWRELPTV